MKEKKLIEMFNRVDKSEKTMDLIIKEVNNLRNFSVSVLEVSKRMPSYDKAVKKLRQDIDKEEKKKEKENK
jgi:predicted ATP-grasp superfamily ATP-dependent carboligase